MLWWNDTFCSLSHVATRLWSEVISLQLAETISWQPGSLMKWVLSWLKLKGTVGRNNSLWKGGDLGRNMALSPGGASFLWRAEGPQEILLLLLLAIPSPPAEQHRGWTQRLVSARAAAFTCSLFSSRAWQIESSLSWFGPTIARQTYV